MLVILVVVEGDNERSPLSHLLGHAGCLSLIFCQGGKRITRSQTAVHSCGFEENCPRCNICDMKVREYLHRAMGKKTAIIR